MGIISAGRTAVTAPVAADARPGPWYRRIDWASSFWIVFLLIPLAFLIRTDMPGPLKALGIVGIGVFACVYIWAVSTMAIWLELPDGAGVLDQLRPVAGRFTLLTGVAAASAPGLNWWYALTYLPYLVANRMIAQK